MTATWSAGVRPSTRARAAAFISSLCGRMLGLASMIRAMVAGWVEASKYVRGCCTPSSKMRKFSRARPVKAAPEASVTLQVTGTGGVTTRIAFAAGPSFDSVPAFFDAMVRNSPVIGSRCREIPESRMLGRGSLDFCDVCECGLAGVKKKSSIPSGKTKHAESRRRIELVLLKTELKRIDA